MQFDPELYKLLFAWTIAYAVIEPFIALLNYFLSHRYGIKSIFEVYNKTSPFLIVGAEFTYLTIIFLKTIWVYKHILKKPKYYPEKGNVKDWRDFIVTYIFVHIVIDGLWAISVNVITSKLHFLAFLKNYSHEFGIYSAIRPLILGVILLLATDVIYKEVGDIEAVGSLMFSLFAVIMASF
jgi:hypothetical protein